MGPSLGQSNSPRHGALRPAPGRSRAVAPVGSTGDSHDNALAEAFNSLFAAELVRNRDLWNDIDDHETATAEYTDWFNHRRLHSEIGLVSPAEHEEYFYRHTTATATADASVPSLH
ncbi:integrase core domain-containing protein [Modestobacter sp. VKM Ac-2983]|uniref:integrase core domain-containing protein n=1 Tax=Modestobacter sp. VKM Ac-2983 TaxID=3004137 RepID=UPI003FA5D9B7